MVVDEKIEEAKYFLDKKHQELLDQDTNEFSYESNWAHRNIDSQDSLIL